MANTRHVVVVRRDLQMVPGLLAAQVAHISDAFMRQRIVKDDAFQPDEKAWAKEPYISVLAVNTWEELMVVKKDAEDAGLTMHLWNDLIPSQIFIGKSLRCDVGLSIGPDDFDKIKLVTGSLPLY